MAQVKHKREVDGKIRTVAREVVDEFGLRDPFAVTEAHVNAAYIRLWDWDKLSVELLSDHSTVRHALELAVREARGADVPETPVEEEPF